MQEWWVDAQWCIVPQEQYYATHQCFYSKRCLYLVVFRLMDGEKGVNEVDGWMRNIQVSWWGLTDGRG